MCSSSYKTSSGMSSGSGTAGTGGGMNTSSTSDSSTFAPAFVTTAPLTFTKPASMRPLMRDREKSWWRAISTMSRRSLISR